jgi:hypothetical protein
MSIRSFDMKIKTLHAHVGFEEDRRYCPEHHRWTSLTAAAVLIVIQLTALSAGAQEDDNPYDTGQSGAAKDGEAKKNTVRQREMLWRLDKMEKRADAADKENEALKQRISELESKASSEDTEKQELEMRMDMMEEAQFSRIEEEQYALKIYGFADVQWYKFFYKDDTLYEGYLNDNNTFGVGHWNLYVEKRLSEKFRFLGEVRFLFQPYGEEVVDEEAMMSGAEYVLGRKDTEATDWVDNYYFDWGGISIQRLWIEYKYNDKFGVRVGNFLTPYGIWNVDHASTVVIPAHRPFIITSQILPESQTGLYFFGRFFPSDSTSIDYALTLSNGRGPTAKLYDLDENKGVGLNLSFNYDGPLDINMGTYMFLDEYTSSQIVLTTATTDYRTETVESYLNAAIALHLKIEWQDVTIQGEFVRSLVKYKDGGRPLSFGALYLTDHVDWASYGLIAYRLPFDAITLRPYFVYEYQKPFEGLNTATVGHNFTGGLNWQITPMVTWKLEVYYHREDREGLRWGYSNSQLHYGVVTSQLAVSY